MTYDWLSNLHFFDARAQTSHCGCKLVTSGGLFGEGVRSDVAETTGN